MGKTLSLSPGFRFHPTDVELVKFYLKRKVLGKSFSVEAVTELDIYKYDPWDLPGKSCLKSRDLKWYFFCPREKKYSSGTRIKRATEFGYWKTTGKDRPVTYNDEVVGMKKTLIFHQGKAPNGDRTNWVMHEYRLEDKNLSDIKDSYVLCMIFEKKGPGPRNGAQYGAPYNEEEWTDGEEEEEVTVTGVSSSVPSFSVPETGQVAGTSRVSPSKELAGSSLFGSCVSEAAGPSPEIPRNNDVEAQMLPALDKNDKLSSLYKFLDDDSLMMDETNKALNYPNQVNEGLVCAPRSDGADVFEDLDDLDNLAGLGEEGFGVSDGFSGGYNDGCFLELWDLHTPLSPPVGNKEDQVPFDQFPTAFTGCPDPGESSC